jgi:hypothetical protein
MSQFKFVVGHGKAQPFSKAFVSGKTMVSSRSDRKGSPVTYSDQVIRFYSDFAVGDVFDSALQLHNPFDAPSRRDVMTNFYRKYFDDEIQRIHIIGINPSKLSSTSTGIHYTDGFALENFCGIENTFSKARELTSDFFYRVVEKMGGSHKFYAKIFPWAAMPVALTAHGKYANYYEVDNERVNEIVSRNIDWLSMLPRTGKLVVLGLGENQSRIKKMGRFPFGYQDIRYLPHPRWALQYNRAKVDEFVDMYIEALS